MGFLSYVIALFCMMGVTLSYYAVHISQMKSADKDYVAACDLDESISCSTVFTSKYSIGMGIIGDILGDDHILNIPNSYVGLVFFPILLVLGFMSSKAMIFLGVLLSVVSSAFSVYLVYILFYVMEVICLVCMPVHFINLGLFILFTIRWSTSGGTPKAVTGKPKPQGGQSKGGKKKSKKDQ